MRQLRNIENILIGLSIENKDEPTAAVSYGLSLAKRASAQVTVYAPFGKACLASRIHQWNRSGHRGGGKSLC